MNLYNFFTKFVGYFIPDSDLTRERWVAGHLSRLKPNSKLLDAGAGECYYARYCSHLKYRSQDFAGYDGKGDRKGIPGKSKDFSKIDIVSDIVDIPVASGSFDVTLCVEVLEHLPRPLDALKELSRVLKKKGSLILTAPFSSLTHYSPFFYYSGFSENFYKVNLPKLGFKVEEMYMYGNYFEYIAFELVRTPLVMWRNNKFYAIVFSLLYVLVIPTFIIFRFLGVLFPNTRELLCLGICVKARKV